MTGKLYEIKFSVWHCTGKWKLIWRYLGLPAIKGGSIEFHSEGEFLAAHGLASHTDGPLASLIRELQLLNQALSSCPAEQVISPGPLLIIHTCRDNNSGERKGPQAVESDRTH